MLFVSTRGKTDLVSASHAITRGLAGDGGLFVPKRFPQIRLGDIKAMEKKPYTERAVDILLQFLTDFTEDELRECVTFSSNHNSAYFKFTFGCRRKINCRICHVNSRKMREKEIYPLRVEIFVEFREAHSVSRTVMLKNTGNTSVT